MAVSKEAQMWIDKAKDDLRWTKNALDGGIWYGACFTAQQAAEKALKALLLNNGWELQKTHDLRYLLEETTVYDDGLTFFLSEAANLMKYYYESRYPVLEEFAQLNEDQAREAYASAKKIVERIESLLLI